MSATEKDPRDKFQYNGFSSRKAMEEDLTRKEELRHQCEVKYLLNLPYSQRMDALSLRESKRGKAVVQKLKSDMLDQSPGCLSVQVKQKVELNGRYESNARDDDSPSSGAVVRAAVRRVDQSQLFGPKP